MTRPTHSQLYKTSAAINCVWLFTHNHPYFFSSIAWTKYLHTICGRVSSILHSSSLTHIRGVLLLLLILVDDIPQLLLVPVLHQI